MITETICLALTLYHEARGEPVDGQVAVAEVVLNRVADPRYPNTICGVVLQPAQFEWVGRVGSPEDPQAWARALLIARAVLEDPDGTLPGTGATHFHEISVSPYWAAAMTETQTLGAHRFYTEGGDND